MDGMYNYIKLDEKPDPQVMLSRLSEKDKCLLTGATENVGIYPVDMNLNNILVSNMATLSKDIIEAIECQYSYSIRVSPFSIIIDSPDCFEDYNRAIVDGISVLDRDELKEMALNKYTGLFELWGHLTKRHVKGISDIKHDDGYYLDSIQYQMYCDRMRLKTKPVSKIIKPNISIIK